MANRIISSVRLVMQLYLLTIHNMFLNINTFRRLRHARNSLFTDSSEAGSFVLTDLKATYPPEAVGLKKRHD